MSEKKYTDLVSVFDEAPLGVVYWTMFILISLAFVLEYFDFYIAGFLVAVLGPEWHLTYLQSSIMLMSAGVGAIVGALSWGVLADAWGRKALIVLATFISGACAGAVGLIPHNAWALFALLRFGVGFGLAGAATAMSALIVEFTPTKWRTMLTGLPTVAATVGTLVAAAFAAALLNLLGWRGLAAAGVAPAVVGVLIFLFVPDSVRWMVATGRSEQARRVVARLVGEDASRLPLPHLQAAPPPVRLRELYADPARFWFTVVAWMGISTANYGVYLWGPSIVAMMMAISVADAAHWFVLVAACGVLGKVAFSFMPVWLGRRRSGELSGYGIAITLTLAALFGHGTWNGVPLFIVFLAAGALFFDGGYCNLSPYTVEIFPVRQAARGFGLGQASNGVGKILGPLCLALIAGAGNLVSPKATSGAVLPAFLFLAFCGLAVGVSFTLTRREMRGKPMDLGIGGPRQPEAAVETIVAETAI
jgi:putative MFS transporter